MFLLILCILLLPFPVRLLTENDVNGMLQEMSTPLRLERFVKSQLSDTSGLISTACQLHMLRFIIALLRRRVWALKMFDSGAKLSSGLLRGHGAALGTFDECLSVTSEYLPILGSTRGKYCQGSFLLANLTNISFNSLIKLPQTRFLSFNEASITLPWGTCFPDSCSAKDIEIFHLSIFKFREETCQTEQSQTTKFDNSDKVAMAILGMIVALVIFSTAFDILYYCYKKEYGSVLLRSFSFVTNGSHIITIKDETSSISAIHGLRVFSLILLMGGMRYFMVVFAPLHNWFDVLKWVTNPDNAFVLELLICMDTFLVISGFLISFKYLEATRNGMSFNFLIYYLNRIMRLTPSLAILVLINATLLRHIGSGPVWPKLRDQWLVDNCRKNWWSSVLYIQNYVNPRFTDICVLPTWYLSVDMQLFVLSPLILFPLRRWPKLTILFVIFLLACSIVARCLSGWLYKIKALLVMQKSLKDVDNYFEHFCFPTHTRAVPWLIGFILGYIIFNTVTNRRTIFNNKISSKLLIIILWLLSIFALVFVILISRIYVEYDYYWLSHSALVGFVQPLWAIGVSWVIYACATGLGGPVNVLLSSPACIVLSRLSYSVYLIYFSVMAFFTYQTRLGLEFNHLELIYRIFADITICVLVGFIWSLLFELPFRTIAKHFIERKYRT